MFITLKAQYIHEYHTLKALFIESAEQGDDFQATELMLRMTSLAKKIDNMESTQ